MEKQSEHEHPGGESHGGYFLHALAAFMYGSEKDFAILLKLTPERLCYSREIEALDLDMDLSLSNNILSLGT